MCLICGYTCRHPIRTTTSGGMTGECATAHKRMYGRPEMPQVWEGDDS